MVEKNGGFSLSNDMVLTVGLGLVVFFLVMTYLNGNKSQCGTTEGFKHVPLHLGGASHLIDQPFAPHSGYGGQAAPYNTRFQKYAEELDMKTQQKRGYRGERYLPSIGTEYDNYMNLEKRKMSVPYADEYDMPGDQYYPKPSNYDNKYGRHCSCDTTSEEPPRRRNSKH